MSVLRKQQHRFAAMVPRLIDKAIAMGYEVTLGDAYRDPRVHGDYGKAISGAYGAKYSEHKRRLAIDLNLFRAGVYLSGTDAHRPLGEWWESQGGIWGGRFNDGNHYQWPDK